MQDVVVVEAVRTPVGKRNGGLSGFHSADLLGLVQREVLQRASVEPEAVDQVFGGCVSQVGMQAFNVTRTAWLSAGLPYGVAATTIDTQCGSSQQAFNVAAHDIASGAIDVAVACGVEVMSRVPLRSSRHVVRDEGLRPTTNEGLAGLKPVLEDGIHTAGNSSQISDGAAAVLLMSADVAAARGLTRLARVRATTIVGVDRIMMLTGPTDATQRILDTTGVTIDDIDVVENNEAFASVVLAWLREHDADPERLNPNGGAIALGHALGSTGVTLVTKALHELRRRGGELALVTMCCGGGLGTGTLLERA